MKLITKYINNNSEYENPNFYERQKVHDWRNYVPDDWRENWNKFSKQEKQIIYVISKIQADNEDWDYKFRLY